MRAPDIAAQQAFAVLCRALAATIAHRIKTFP